MSNEIWVFVEQQESKVKKVTFELLSAGAEFSKKTGSQLAAILLGSGLQETVKSLISFADKIYLTDDLSLASYTSEVYSINLALLIKEHQPSILLGEPPPQEGIFSQGWPCVSRRVTLLIAPVLLLKKMES